MNPNLDSEFEGYWPELEDTELEQEMNPGLKPPTTGLTSTKATVKTAAGPKDVTIQTWTEIGYVVSAGAKPGSADSKFAELKPVLAWIRVQTSKEPYHATPNPGRFLEADFTRFYPQTLKMSQEQLEKIVDEAPADSPRKSWKARKFDTIQAHRKWAALLRATGYAEKLTAGEKGPAAFKGLHTIPDILANKGEALRNIPIKVIVQKGRPDWGGNVADHVIVGYEPYTE